MNKKLLWIIITLYLVLSMIAGAIYGQVNYNYNVDKCTNLKISNYNFNYDVQIDAHYAKDCYNTLNHSFALTTSILGGMIMFVFVAILIGLIPASFILHNYY